MLFIRTSHICCLIPLLTWFITILYGLIIGANFFMSLVTFLYTFIYLAGLIPMLILATLSCNLAQSCKLQKLYLLYLWVILIFCLCCLVIFVLNPLKYHNNSSTETEEKVQGMYWVLLYHILPLVICCLPIELVLLKCEKVYLKYGKICYFPPFGCCLEKEDRWFIFGRMISECCFGDD